MICILSLHLPMWARHSAGDGQTRSHYIPGAWCSRAEMSSRVASGAGGDAMCLLHRVRLHGLPAPLEGGGEFTGPVAASGGVA